MLLRRRMAILELYNFTPTSRKKMGKEKKIKKGREKRGGNN